MNSEENSVFVPAKIAEKVERERVIRVFTAGIAIELPAGRIVSSRNFFFMHATSSLILTWQVFHNLFSFKNPQEDVYLRYR
ncbi:MAG: hypothetical protein NC826_03340 [Candidatus Omnitrophica bacterium]|nr:hypothetical protein [Candidatus Omnitrophota bacterium]